MPVRTQALLRRLREADDGFTLAELLVALAIISGALLALLGGFITSARSLQSQQEQSRAMRVALDLNESMRLEPYETLVSRTVADSALPAEQRKGCGSKFVCEVVISPRTAGPVDAAGRTIKDVTTKVTYRANGKSRTATFTSAVAEDARTVGLPPGYVKAIRGVTVSPNPSTVVNFDGQTEDDVVVNVVLTGFDPENSVTLTWTDSAARTRTVESVDGRNWKFLLPKLNSTTGLHVPLNVGEQRDITFTASAPGGLKQTATLRVFGPATNRPSITAWAVSPNPVSTFKNGNNRFENRQDVTFTCTVNWVSDANHASNSVKAVYIGETGTSVEQVLTRGTASGMSVTYTHLFRASTWYPWRGELPYSCVARRGTDGGPASRSINVRVN
jgi:prepilin-type N-terminal cleavage/methylation domain-containing protein